MTRWFTSLHGAILLSAAALVTELWRAFVDLMVSVFPYHLFNQDPGAVFLATLLYTVLFGGWAWALVRAARGSRRALMAVFSLNLVFLLAIPVGTLIAYCPSPCPTVWPLMEAANWVNLLVGLLATASLAVQLLRGRSEANAYSVPLP